MYRWNTKGHRRNSYPNTDTNRYGYSYPNTWNNWDSNPNTNFYYHPNTYGWSTVSSKRP